MDFQIETEEKDEEVKAKEVEPRYIPKENPKNSWRLGSWSTIEPKTDHKIVPRSKPQPWEWSICTRKRTDGNRVNIFYSYQDLFLSQ